jgi:hypothetical protein
VKSIHPNCRRLAVVKEAKPVWALFIGKIRRAFRDLSSWALLGHDQAIAEVCGCTLQQVAMVSLPGSGGRLDRMIHFVEC